MSSIPDMVVVFCTIPDAEQAAALARDLVESRLAACANIIPAIRSIYAWKEKICDEAEALMIIKTRKSLVEKLRQKIVSRHPYEVPEVVSLEVFDTHPPYLAWLLDATDQAPRR